jgi:DNA modification methylase
VQDTVLIGDALTVLKTVPDESVQCCVTSPPYWGQRDYGVVGQIGKEQTPALYVAALTAVFMEVYRVLKRTGTLWLNLGDSYNCYAGNRGPSKGSANKRHHEIMPKLPTGHGLTVKTLKNKDMLGLPWRVAFALQDAGWYLRSDIIWAKPNPTPESVRDRPTKSHEYVFLFSKSDRYFYNAAAIAEELTPAWRGRSGKTRNRRSVWTISTKPYRGAHFATFPEELPSLCILAGSRPNERILDPFAGSGTTCAAAKSAGRHFLGIELNAEYTPLFNKRIAEAV